ncbi:uncharacterized protein N7484_011729 [Penicillium longicatenatum]|uniref:uncharacterized protein n=1 Tax=Penicillium longicatenatum TaxID=1561947 RepID=UPI0025495258|nr:uncharacterized protein N7484_011729 [Penicillium longicatenatum]KAJ5631629.1 hypothetical protein N7484_011729 [Penicillium longicatenatum]
MHEPLIKAHQGRNRKKVKSGCKTCKTRRVKCDESRPACRRCVSTGRICDGYGIWGGGGSPYGQPQGNRALSTYCTPVPTGSMTSEEQTYFDWFMDKTTKKFAGLFASDFWETLVLQASAQEPAVRHAVVALSAAHRFDRSNEPWSIPSTYLFDVERFTLQQYNKAIHHLRLITGSTQKNTLRVALVTCLIFVTLEYLRGQYQIGSAHLRYGIQLLASISAPKPRSSLSPNILSPADDFAHNALIDSYSRLTIQAAMFGHVPSHMCIVTRDPQVHALPYIFPSLLDARQTLDDLLNRVHCLKRHYYNLRSSQSQLDIADPEMVEAQQKIINDLSLWRKAYNASLTRLEAEASRKDKFGNILLRVYHELATIMALVCLSDDEMVFDTYTENFLAILKGFNDLWNFWADASIQIKELKHIFSIPESDDGCHGFTVESGFIPPIYYTALKCRIPRIRQHAIRVLQAAPHREGVWNGALLAHIVREVVRIEEGDYTEDVGADEPMYTDMPSAKEFALPETEASRRISDVAVILPDQVKGDTFVSYKKQLGDGQWETYKQRVKPGWMKCAGSR